ncbi:MAG: hypothetical protein JRJ19_06170 [Deltaproteobacteria bacterium]|nr:hypothetical protein [Deltaproteobacteria bacterium]MBW1871631.1 hypothetical protein [Deltaproteobacteria bacterium]
MKTQINMFALGLILALAGCGGGKPEVWLVVNEDGSRPCMGASHLRVKVNLPGQQPDVVTFDEFGLFFSIDQLSCTIFDEFRFPDLPLGTDISLEFSLSDSTTEDKGVLSIATSNSFDISGGSPIQEVYVDLYRRPGVSQGTLVVIEPSDWGNIAAGIQSLQFRITKQGDTQPIRAYYITYDPVSRPEPFPLIISNLPAPDSIEQYTFLLEGMDGQEPPQVLRPWSGDVWLIKDEVSFLTF